MAKRETAEFGGARFFPAGFPARSFAVALIIMLYTSFATFLYAGISIS
jgi:hypothetical protein